MIKHTSNANLEGGTSYGIPIYVAPIRRQRQILVSKKLLKKHQRQFFNNLSLSRKVEVRKIGILGARLTMR